MKLFFFLAACLLCNAEMFGQNFDWAKSIGGVNSDVGYSTTVDANGNIYTVGSFSGTVDFNPGPGVFNLSGPPNFSLFILKQDSAGNFIWAKAVSSTASFILGTSIKLDSFANVYITGSFSGTVDFDPSAGVFNLTASGNQEIYIEKLDSAGNFIWARQMLASTNSGCRGEALSLDKIGNIYITGHFEGTVDYDPGSTTFNLTSSFNGSNSDIFIQKLSSAGNLIWAKTVGAAQSYTTYSYNDGLAINVDNFGNVIITGRFDGTIDFDPGTAAFIVSSASSFNQADVFVEKLNANGNFIWVKTIGSYSLDYGLSIAIDKADNIFTSGVFTGTVDFDPGPNTFNLTSSGSYGAYLQKLSPDGDFVWAEQISGLGSGSIGYALALDTTGNIFTTGIFSGVADFDPGSGSYNLSATNGRTYIQKLDNSGNFVWAKQIGGDVNSISVSGSSDVVLTGTYSNTQNFGAGSSTFNLNSNGQSDIFIEKLAAGASSLISISNSISNSSSFNSKVLWHGNTNQSSTPIKICADGSQATHISLVNHTGIPSGKIKFWIGSDTVGADSYASGYFINYAIHPAATGDTVTAELAHPKYLAAAIGLFRPDNFRIIDTSNSYPNIFTIPIQLYRAPVLLVHGLWGDISTFNGFESSLDADGKYPRVLTFNVDYVQTHDKSFTVNSSIISNNINTLFSFCRNNGFSAGKVDIIGHSMGGLLARQYIQSAGYRSDIRKLITLNTPHAGTQVANFLCNPNYHLAADAVNAWVRHYIGGSFNNINGGNSNSIYNGAVSDLRAGTAGNKITTLNTGSNQNFGNYTNIASHAVTTSTNVFSDITLGALLAKQYTLAIGSASVSAALNTLYQGESNDLVVPLSSQQGGLSGGTTSLVNNQWHISCDNVAVQNELRMLLDAKPDSSVFDHAGFVPPVLISSYKLADEDTVSTKQAGSGKVTINAPAINTIVTPGEQIVINVNSTGTINHLTTIESNEVAGLNFNDTAVANASFNYIVPQSAVGNISVVAVGADPNGIVAYDSLLLSVSIAATLDSMHFYPEEIVIPVRNNFAINLTGYFHDGIVRNLNFVNGIQYKIADTSIAVYAGMNLVFGKHVGTTSLRITYLGDTVAIPLSVLPGDINFPPTSTTSPTDNLASCVISPIKIFPNPNSGDFTVQFPITPGDLVTVTVVNQIGQKVFAETKTASGKNFVQKISLPKVSAGPYFIRVKTSTQNYTGRMVLLK